MKRFIGFSLASVVLLAVIAAYGQSPKAAVKKSGAQTGANDVSVFMQLKLKHSQKVLEGVVLKDFPMIAKNAQQLALLTEDENWMVIQTPEYRQHSARFKQLANRLTAAAEEQNIDRAALEYVQLTLNCVDCHKHVREHRD